MRLPSVMSSGQHFSMVPRAEIQRSSFDRSHGHKTTMNAGYLVPIFVDEALPGDTFNVNMTGFFRMTSQLRPIMDNLFFDTFFFAVPIRLVWDNFKKFNGEQVNPGDSTSYVVPTMTAPGGGYGELSLQDYMGIPTKVAGLAHSALWTRAYNLIWNEWFRDENLQNSVVVDKGDGPDNPANYVLLQRGKRHDYFTSCLPWPQKGAAVSLALGTTAPVVSAGTGAPKFNTFNGGPAVGLHAAGTVINSNIQTSVATSGSVVDPMTWNTTSLQADLSSATAATINSLRQAFQIQKMYERDARGGTRYTEIVRSHFGVISPDARLQRPEYLGGGSTRLDGHTTEGTFTSTNLFWGQMSGVSRDGFTKSFTEHCVLIGLASIRADLNYQQGLNRMFSRSTRFDFFWPALAHLGEQAVLQKEIYADGTANDNIVFGYQERYAEYRYKPSIVTGRFRSNCAAPMDVWHLAQQFGAAPTLNAAFIVENPPMSRVVAVTTEPQFYVDLYFKMNCVRPMPVYSVPGLVDHF